MGIGEDIKQKSFSSQYSKATINIIYTHLWLQQQHVDIFKKVGLTIPQFNVLRILRGQFPEPSTINLIIDRMLDKSSNASRIVDKLEQKELVLRKRCKDDRRAVDVFISEKGLKQLTQIDEYLKRWEDANRKLSDEECDQLNFLLDKIRQ